MPACGSKFFHICEVRNLSIWCRYIHNICHLLHAASPVSYSYLSILLNGNADIFAASLWISYCSFSSQILPSVVMISFYILSKRFILKREGLSDARVLSITNKTWFFNPFFVKIHKVSKANIWWMIKFNILKVFFRGYFIIRLSAEFSLVFFGTAK